MAREEKINLNTADINELQRVSGLGQTRQHIFEHYPFKDWEDVKSAWFQ